LVAGATTIASPILIDDAFASGDKHNKKHDKYSDDSYDKEREYDSKYSDDSYGHDDSKYFDASYDMKYSDKKHDYNYRD
jgi:hypothetical protein